MNNEEKRLWQQYLVRVSDAVNAEVMLEHTPIATEMCESFVSAIGGSHAGESL